MKYWIESMRLRTLPLALANTITGSALAWVTDAFRWQVFVLAAITTLLLQILSNMANDYGDFKNGKDTTERIGPRRMVQSGKITPKAMLRAISIVVVLAIVTGIWLIIEGFSNRTSSVVDTMLLTFNYSTLIMLFALLGISAIVAAIRYTVGKNPYGYKAMGDLFVFLFFGLVGVLGTYFLHAFTLRWSLLFPSAAVGLLSVGVLNLNNLRDYEADKKTGKRTLVVALGLPKARLYHAFLLFGAFSSVTIFTLLEYHSHWQWIYWAAFPLIFRNLITVFTFTEHTRLNPELKRLSMASLLFAVLFSIGLIC